VCEFHRLVEQQIRRSRRYARALTRNRDRADDLVQDTVRRTGGMFIRTQQEIYAFRSARSARAYLAGAGRFPNCWIWKNAQPSQLCRG
jgi:DNA-directed RNA polymerase specialized sigma24 family protein